MIFKRSLHFTPACHLTLDRSSSSNSSSSGVRRVAQAPIKAISYYNSSHTPRELQAAAARGLDCCWAARSKRGALCKTREMRPRVPSTSIKTRFASKSYVRTQGWGMQKPNPRGRCGNPGICLKCAQGQKSLKGLPRSTHCTDRAQTSSNLSPTVELCPPHPTFRIKVRARRDVPKEEKNDNYT